MKTPAIIHYTVHGRGDFPTDMLRYDSSWPRDAAAVMNITLTHEDGEMFITERGVDLSGLGCTPARWESFGWRVER